jgi:glycolate oxidase FAD binding subunit
MPLTLESLQQQIAAAADQRTPLEPMGAGTKRGYGRAVAGAVPGVTALDVRELAGVLVYQPEELICVVRPGTPLAELEAVLAERRQMLAFEPPHWAPGATVGGVVACNLSGPRRFKAGAARDHLLGFQAVTGRGEVIRGGGRVVKNVTGYDLSKLVCGSFGTLVVLTEVCLKVLPRPEAERTVAVTGLVEAAALALLGDAARTQQEPTGLAYLPAGAQLPAELAARSPGGSPGGSSAGSAGVALIRVEGPERAVTAQALALAAAARERGGAAAVLDPAPSRETWRAVRELEGLPLASGERLWRLSVPAAAGGAVGDALRGRLGPRPARLVYDWAGGLVWAALPPLADGWIHDVARAAGGHASLLRSSAPVPLDLDAFTPLDPVQRKLHAQLKNAFDPAGILNPGRMYAGL